MAARSQTRDLIAFASIELLRASFLRRWRGAYDGPQDFGRLFLFMWLMTTLALLSYTTQRDSVVKIYQSLLGLINISLAPVVVAFSASDDNNYAFTLKDLAALNVDIGEKFNKAKAIAFKEGRGSGLNGSGIKGIELPGFEDEPGDQSDEKGKETAPRDYRDPFRIWGLAADTTLVRYYTKGTTPDDLGLWVVLNKNWFDKNFKFAKYAETIKNIREDHSSGKERKGIRGEPDLPEACVKSPATCDLTSMRNIVMHLGQDASGYQVFRAIWHENLQTPVPVAAIVPFGLLDMVDYSRELDRKVPRELGPPLDGAGKVEFRVRAFGFTKKEEKDGEAILRDLAKCGTRPLRQDTDGGTRVEFIEPVDKDLLETCGGELWTTLSERYGAELEYYPRVRYCAPSALIVPVTSIDVRRITATDAPEALGKALRERHGLSGRSESLAPTDLPESMDRLRAEAKNFCRNGVDPLRDDETLFFTGKLTAAIVEFPQSVDLPAAVDYVRNWRGDRGSTILRIADEQSRSIARTGLLKAFQEKSSLVLMFFGFGLFALLAIATIHALVDRRVRSYALLQMLGFSQSSVQWMVVGQVGLISLLSSFAALLTYELIAAAVNFWFVHDDVFKNARRSLGYDDTELFKSLSLFEASLMVFALVSIAVILAAWILQSSAFGMPSPLERAARSATGAHARIPDLIENLTRAS